MADTADNIEAVFYPFRRYYSDRVKDLEALGMPEGIRRSGQVAWLFGLDISVDDIAWLLGIDRLTVRRHLKSNLSRPPLVVARDRLWKHVLPSHVARLQALNERDRAMLRAHNAGATYREISLRVGIWPGQVGTQIHKARTRLAMKRLTPVENYFNEVGDLEKLLEEPELRCPTCGRMMKTPPPV